MLHLVDIETLMLSVLLYDDDRFEFDPLVTGETAAAGGAFPSTPDAHAVLPGTGFYYLV